MLIHHLDIGGAESMTAHLARHLHRAGHAVEIGCLGELGRLGAELRAEGLAVLVHARRAGLDLLLAARLAMRVHRAGFDVVHLHQRTALFYGGLAGLLHGAPIVYTEHGPLQDGPPSARQIAFNRMLRRRLSRITAVSRHLESALAADEGFDASSIAVVPNAVEAGRFASRCDRDAVRAQNGLPLGGRLVVSVGRLHTVKNQRVLLEVVAHLKNRFPDLAAVLIGDGPAEGSLRALADRLGIGDRVFFLGARNDVERLLPACDVFCLPSLAEGIPVSMLEAMAARVPIVATAVGGVPEAVADGREAILIGDPRAAVSSSDPLIQRCAAAVASLLSDPERACRLTDAAFRRVTDEFSLAGMCARYEEVLSGAAMRGRAAAGAP